MEWVRKTTDPGLIEAPTGSGKSHIIAAIAADLHQISGGKHILCLAPSAELVTQNREKYPGPSSIFSASAGGTSLRHPVVFGTPLTVKNKVRRFGPEFCAVVLDEAHRLTPTIRHIIEHMREQNPNLRVLGLSATPYRLGEGYIYAIDPDGRPTQAEDPYFAKCLYRIQARELIAQGYLTPPVVGRAIEHYETLGLELNSRHQFDARDIDRAFHGHGRKTSRIVADVVAQSRDRQGVMIFAATIQHAQEVMASLPPGLSALVTGKTKRADRERILRRFKARELKYLVNVAVLTTGFDAPHVDVIALLRATESVSLLQQIIGRGLRIEDGKQDCLILDYAENVERHCPDGDVFDPQITVRRQAAEAEELEAICEECGTPNTFRARKNDDGFQVDEHGYFLDLAGNRIQTDHGFMPAHYGRRCFGMRKVGATHERCDYRWTLKECPECGAENDIAARYCEQCRGELIDPNEKLRIEFAALKKDPTRIQTDEVLDMQVQPTVSRAGNECLRVVWTTPYRSFTTWLTPKVRREWDRFHALDGQPRTVSYRKDPDSGFYRVLGYNHEADKA